MAKIKKAGSLDDVVDNRLIKRMREEKELRIFQKNVREKLAYHIKHYAVSFILTNDAKKKFMSNAYGLTLWLDSDSRLCMELSVDEPILLLSQPAYLNTSKNLRLILEAPGYDYGDGLPFTDGVVTLPKQEYEKLLVMNSQISAKLRYYDELQEQMQSISRAREFARAFRGPTKLRW